MHVRSLSLQKLISTLNPRRVAKALAVLTMFTAPVSQLAAQMPSRAPGYGGQPMPYVDSHGNSFVTQVGYEQPCDCGGPGMVGGMGAYPGPNAMGCGGTYPPVGYDLAA